MNKNENEKKDLELTNKTNLPEPIFEVFGILYNSHPKPMDSKYYTTELLKSPKEVILNREHYGEKIDDVQEVMAAIFGTAVHSGIENKLKELYPDIVEQRWEAPLEVETDFGTMPVLISGAIDLLWMTQDGNYHIIDWKSTTSTKVDMERDGREDSWKKQGYIYAWLLEKNTGVRPVDIIMCALKKDVKGKPDFSDPKTWMADPVVFPTTDREFEKTLLDEYRGKLKDILHHAISNEEPRQCTAEERWQKPPKFAVKLPKNDKATRKFDTVAEAQNFIMEKGWIGKGYQILEIPSEPTNCCYWCNGRNWCEQGKKAVEAFNAINPKTYNDKGELV